MKILPSPSDLWISSVHKRDLKRSFGKKMCLWIKNLLLDFFKIKKPTSQPNSPSIRRFLGTEGRERWEEERAYLPPPPSSPHPSALFSLLSLNLYSPRVSSPFGGYRKKYTREWHARRDATAGNGGEMTSRGFVARSRARIALAWLASLAQMESLLAD